MVLSNDIEMFTDVKYVHIHSLTRKFSCVHTHKHAYKAQQKNIKIITISLSYARTHTTTSSNHEKKLVSPIFPVFPNKNSLNFQFLTATLKLASNRCGKAVDNSA